MAGLIGMIGVALLGAMSWWALLRIPSHNIARRFLYAGVFALEVHGAAALANVDPFDELSGLGGAELRPDARPELPLAI